MSLRQHGGMTFAEGNQMLYCGKHDKVYQEGQTCLGCDTEQEKPKQIHVPRPEGTELIDGVLVRKPEQAD